MSKSDIKHLSKNETIVEPHQEDFTEKVLEIIKNLDKVSDDILEKLCIEVCYESNNR